MLLPSPVLQTHERVAQEGLVSALYGHLYSLNKIRNDDLAACLIIFMTRTLLSAYDSFYVVEAKKSILTKMFVYYISVKIMFRDFIDHARILQWSTSCCIGLTPDPLMLRARGSVTPDKPLPRIL